MAPWRRATLSAAFAGTLLIFAPTGLAATPTFDIASLDRAGARQVAAEFAAGADPALDPRAVISGAAPLDFEPGAGRAPQFRQDGRDVWIRYRVTNSSGEPKSGKFIINFAYLERVDLFEVLPGGALRRSTAGSAVPNTGAAVATGYPTFQMMLAPDETRDYYIRVRSDSVLFFPLRMVSESRFSHALTRDTLIWSLIAGTALAFASYAASMSFGSARGAYRAYLGFSISAAVYILVSSGLMNALLASGPEVNFNTLVYATQAIVIAFGTLFITRFLEMRHVAPRLYLLFIAQAGIAALTGISFILPEWASRLSYLVAAGLGPLVLMGGLGWLTWRGVPGARSLFAAWTPCFLATAWMYLRVVNVAPYLPINHFVVPLSFAFTLAHLSAILGGRAKEAELWANNDMLTGLGNRRLLTTLIDLENREPSDRYGAAIAIDLDNFKPVNDQFGHAAGDAVLVSVGERLRATFKGKGDLFRLGGDEFLILAYSTLGRMEIINLAGDYLAANRQPVAFEELELSIDASIGVAFWADHGGLEEMLKQADAELYAVKQAGRGMVRVADQRKAERRRTRRAQNVTPPVAAYFARSAERPSVAANDENEIERVNG